MRQGSAQSAGEASARPYDGRMYTIMGVVNVTPDSFSDGGAFDDDRVGDRPRRAGWSSEGAAIVDVGGESTRPGADPVPADEELGA